MTVNFNCGNNFFVLPVVVAKGEARRSITHHYETLFLGYFVLTRLKQHPEKERLIKHWSDQVAFQDKSNNYFVPFDGNWLNHHQCFVFKREYKVLKKVVEKEWKKKEETTEMVKLIYEKKKSLSGLVFRVKEPVFNPFTARVLDGVL